MNKPRIGVLALMLEAYEPLFDGITNRQTKYVSDMLSDLSSCAEFIFPKIARNRSEIEELTALYNNQGLNGIVIFFLSYSQGQYLVRAMQKNYLPLALVLVQPDETVANDFEEIDLTVNQGIHGAQDNSNCLIRAGIKCAYYAGSKHDGKLLTFIESFAVASKAVSALKSMKIAVIGKLAGMGDVITDDMAVYKKLGPEFVYDSIGTVQTFCERVSETEIESRINYEREQVFDVDTTLTHDAYSKAVRMYIGIKNYLIANEYSGYTAHFEEFGADGRFTQLPLLAASSLMADGYGYAAEGDASCAALGAAMNILCGICNFSEMYMMDFKREAILFCHAGEGNWKTARKDKKPYLKNRVFGEGGLDNPPTPIFTPSPGVCGVMSLVYLGADKFRLVYAHGEVLDECSLTKCDMPYMFFKPVTNMADCVRAWLENAGTHHEIIVFGEHRDKIRLFCRLADIEFVEL